MSVYVAMIYLAMAAVYVIGTSCLVFLALYAATYTFREILSARNIQKDFVEWRKETRERKNKGGNA